MSDDTKPGPRLFGLLVTFQRPEALTAHLDALAKQTRIIDHLLVVDNDATRAARPLVAEREHAAATVDYLAMPDNLGPAGALARGLGQLVARAEPHDWVVLLDDDDWPLRDDLLEQLLAFAEAELERRPMLGMVGLVGARFDFRRGQVVRLRDDELHGTVSVDYVGGSQLPLVRLAAVNEVGGFAEELFFGFDDLEFGLRLRRAGYDVVVDGALAHWGRVDSGRLGAEVGAVQLATTTLRPWRRYYSVRNLVVILRRHGRPWAAARVSLTAGVAKGFLFLARQGRAGLPHLTASLRAVVDAWRDRLGRRYDPT